MIPCTIGPRQITGAPSPARKPIDMSFKPKLMSGWIFLSGVTCGRPGDVQHERDRRPVDVAVEQADLGARLGEREREVHGHGRLADAALAARHGDHVLHVLEALWPRGVRRAAGLRGHRDFDRLHARQLGHSGPRLALEALLDRARRGRELDRECDFPAFDAQVLHEPEIDDRAIEIWILDRAERVQHVALGELAHRALLGVAWGGRRSRL